jgi:hypothetical protein
MRRKSFVRHIKGKLVYHGAHVTKMETSTPWSFPQKWETLWRALMSGGNSSDSHIGRPPVAQHLVRLKTYAAERDVSVKTLRRRIAKGEITGYRFGPKIIMIDSNEVDALLLKRIPYGGGRQ